MVATLGSGRGVAVDAATFGVSALLLAGLRLRASERTVVTSVLRDLRDGWQEFTSRTWLWVVVLGFGVLNAISVGAWNTLGPVIADQTIGAGAWGLVLAVPWSTALGQLGTAGRLSRVAAYDALGSFVAIPLGQLVAGRLAAVHNPSSVVLAGAIGYAVVVAAVLLSRDVRRLPHTTLE